MKNFPENIFQLVRTERDNFLNNHIEIVPGYTFNQYETIKKIHKYYNSQFDNDNYEVINGVRRKKTFYNISKWRCKVATKMLDLDVKDFLITSNSQKQDTKVQIFSVLIKKWLKKHKMGKLLNKIVKKLPIYGTAVIEKTNDGAKLVDLRYLMNDQSVDKLEDGWFIIKELMSAADLRAMRDKWDNVDEAIDKFISYKNKTYEDDENLNKASQSPYIEVYRYHGEVPKSWITGKDSDDDTWVKARFFVTGVDYYTIGDDNKKVYGEGIILYKEELKEYPVKEVHLDKTDGRWLGIGYVEDTFEAQRRVNETKNQEAKAIELGSMIMFQTQDQLATNNVLSDQENGDIIRSNNPINRIDNTNRSMPDFNAVHQSYETLSDRATFTHDVVRGEAPPASTTLGAVQLQVQQATSVYDYSREDIGMFLNDYLIDLTIPQLKKDLKKELEFMIDANDPKMKLLKERYIDKSVEKIVKKNPRLPEDLVRQQVRRKLMDKGNKFWIKATEDQFRDIEKYIDIEITGEGKNVGAMLQNTQYFLSTIAANPAVLQNKVLRTLMFQIMSMVGLDSTEIEQLAEEANEEAAQMQQMQEMQQQQMQEQPQQPPNELNPNNDQPA